MSAYSCRWAWCRQVCSTKEQLRQHADTHLAEGPILVRELAARRRAEDGTGQSYSLGLASHHSQDTSPSYSSLLPPQGTPSSAEAQLLSPRRLTAIAFGATPEPPSISNPVIPGFRTLMHMANVIPNGLGTPHSSQDSDASVERQLTQDLSFDSPLARDMHPPRQYGQRTIRSGTLRFNNGTLNPKHLHGPTPPPFVPRSQAPYSSPSQSP